MKGNQQKGKEACRQPRRSDVAWDFSLHRLRHNSASLLVNVLLRCAICRWDVSLCRNIVVDTFIVERSSTINVILSRTELDSSTRPVDRIMSHIYIIRPF